MRVLFSGGGTGGHLVPGLELARLMLARGHTVSLVRAGRAVERSFLDGVEGLRVDTIQMNASGLRLPLALSRSMGKARRLLDELRPDVVVGLGGSGSLPSVLAARTRRLPIALLEQNVKPGKANRFAARFAHRVCTGFPEAAKAMPARKAICTGMPLRRGLGRPEDAGVLARFGIDRSLTIVLVVGGSQGAQALNVHVPRLLAQLDRATREGIAVVHLAGAGKERQTSAAYAALGLPAHVLPFGRDMPSLYSVADVVICRGGATTLTEVAASGCCAVSVPYPWHRDRHQLHNAMWFEQRGAGRVLEQRVLEVGEARTVIEPLLKDPDLRRAMAKRARASVPTDGAARILGELTGLTCRPEAAAPSRVQAVR